MKFISTYGYSCTDNNIYSSQVATYLPTCFTCYNNGIYRFAELHAVGKVYDKEDLLVPDQELIAIGTANIVGAFFTYTNCWWFRSCQC